MPCLAALLSSSLSWSSHCGIQHTFPLAALQKKGSVWIFSHLISSKRIHPANLFNSPFVINTWQEHFKSIFLLEFCFFHPEWKELFLPLRVYVSLFHWHWFLCHTAQLRSEAWNLSLLYIATGVHFLYYFSDITSFFGKTKDLPSAMMLFMTYFRKRYDPGILHFGSAVAKTAIMQDFPMSEDSHVPCGSQRAHTWVDMDSNNGRPVLQSISLLEAITTSSLWSFANI